jgi:putative transposase
MFSISPGHRADLERYIDSQENHHRTVSFPEEYRKLCSKYGVAIDERYVWD